MKQNINWKEFWKAKGNPKQKIFMWKIMKGALPVGCERKKRGLGDDYNCRLCSIDDSPSSSHLETIEHLFRECSFASHLWKGCRLGLNFANQADIPLAEWIYNWMRMLNDKKRKWNEEYNLLLAVLDCIWEIRNNKIFRNINLNSRSATISLERKMSFHYSRFQNSKSEAITDSENSESGSPGFEYEHDKEQVTNLDKSTQHIDSIQLVTGAGSCSTITLGISHNRRSGKKRRWEWLLKSDGVTFKRGEDQQQQ